MNIIRTCWGIVLAILLSIRPFKLVKLKGPQTLTDLQYPGSNYIALMKPLQAKHIYM